MERQGRVFSATDLVNYIRCEHLAGLERRAQEGELTRPAPSAEELLVIGKGDAHEARYVANLREAGVELVELERPIGLRSVAAAAGATLEAMRSGVAVIHNATLFDGEWLGVADFLRRVEQPSALGPWRYEVADTKLARNAMPALVVQLCAYTELLAAAQGAAPERMIGLMGDGHEELFRYADYGAYYRSIKGRFLRAVAEERTTYPQPVEHCGRCRWSERCSARRAADDHLSGVANIRRGQVARLNESGVATIAQLASLPPEAKPPAGIGREAFGRLRAQAALQVAARGGEHRYEFLAPRPQRGFERLPKPSEGDIFFDMEGDPFVEGGLEYLFGVAYLEEGLPVFRAFWGHDRAAEGKAFQAFVDFVAARRGRYPDLHVYHYAPYEVVALKKLMSRHATREDEVDSFLREDVFVDLYGVVREAVRVSHPSYSLKKVETFYRGLREAGVKDAIGSVVSYERWRETGERALLEEIEAYNRDDCVSTFELREWLLRLRGEFEASEGVAVPRRTPIEAESEERTAVEDELEAVREQLRAAAPPPAPFLIDYHKREAKPDWWAYFERCRAMPEELIDDPEAIGDLSIDGDVLPFAEKRSTIHTLRFPPQEHKLREGMEVDDPRVPLRRAGTIVMIDTDGGVLQLKRGPGQANAPMPRALIAKGPIPDNPQRDAVRRFSTALLDGNERYAALRDIVERRAPRIAGLPAGSALEGSDPEALARLALGLDESYLFIQGPPGSGKTYAGARVVVRLLQAGKRVGIAAPSHKAIHNLLHAVEAVAAQESVTFCGLKKATGKNAESYFDSRYGFIASSEKNDDFPPGRDVALVAGTAWLFSRGAMDGALDYLIVDEAGQVALADAVAMGTAARNIVLLGDPLQLAQVSKAIHPENSGASVLEHLLGEEATIPAEQGVFLPTSYRMHPAVCTFISELAYDGRLGSAPSCARQALPVAGGAGLRWLPVLHEGNAQESRAEALAIAEAIRSLLGAGLIDQNGTQRIVGEGDCMVVTPYNVQALCLRRVLAKRGLENVRVGTVDKFQGQEAPVVFFSMATSSGDDLPRDLEFLFSRNRLNVAVSRARTLAVLVASPKLLHVHCSTVEQLRMVNALCRFVELAEPLGAAQPAARQQIAFDFGFAV